MVAEVTIFVNNPAKQNPQTYNVRPIFSQIHNTTYNIQLWSNADRLTGVQQVIHEKPSKHTNSKVQLQNRAKRAIARPAYLRDYVWGYWLGLKDHVQGSCLRVRDNHNQQA